MPEMKMVYTPCQGWACHERCILSTYVNEDGVIDHCERMYLPEEFRNTDHPGRIAQRTCICQKGALAGQIPYMEGRIKYPMKRVGKRGEGKFERISWDQALSEIADKLSEIRAKYGTRSVMVNNFCCGYAGYPASIGYSLGLRLMGALDASGFEPEAIDVSVINAENMQMADPLAGLLMDTQLFMHADYLITWGGNFLGYTRAGHTSRSIMHAMEENGAKLVNVGILYDSNAAKADEFLRVKPGTDYALAFAMCRHIIEKDYLDKKYLSEATTAPFFVRPDDGRFLRESDYIEGGDPSKLAFWDKKSNSMQFVVAAERNFGDYEPDLFAVKVVDGVEYKTGLVRYWEAMEPYTFEVQEKITGVPAEVAERITEEYVAAPQAGIYLGAGLRYKNSTVPARAICMLPVLTGKSLNDTSGVLCEGIGDGAPIGYNLPPVVLGGIENPFVPMVSVKEMLENNGVEGKQQYKALINNFSNPVHNWPSRSLWEDEIFPMLELIVVFEIRETETTSFADYVLPDLTVFERETVLVHGDCMVCCDPAIEPVGEARDQSEIFKEILNRMGLGHTFPNTIDEYRHMLINPEDPLFKGIEPPINYDRIREEKIVRLNSPYIPHLYRDTIPPTEFKRYNLYVEDLAHVDAAVPKYYPNLIDDEEMRKKYPLQLFVGRSRFFAQGQFREIPELYKLSGNGPRLGMFKEDALARGINEGDLVEIFNDKGVVKVPVHFSRVAQPGMVYLWYPYNSKDYKYSGPATILGSNLNVHEALNDVSLAWGDVWYSNVRKSGAPEHLAMQTGIYGNETIWDVLCEVRKAD